MLYFTGLKEKARISNLSYILPFFHIYPSFTTADPASATTTTAGEGGEDGEAYGGAEGDEDGEADGDGEGDGGEEPSKTPSSVCSDSCLFISHSSGKARFPILLTDDGIGTLDNALHPEKALAPMLVTDDGISRLANELHPWKA